MVSIHKPSILRMIRAPFLSSIMAPLIAAVSQNVGFHPAMIAAMPVTGISTLSILLIGQMIDLPADKATGKMGLVARRGIPAGRSVYPFIQLMLCLDVLLLSFRMIPNP